MESLEIENIIHAPWNPRTADEMGAAHPAMMELIKSIKALGVIEPIIVWPRNDLNRYVCIAGNRRLAAAQYAGLDEIPAVVRDDIDENAARAITRAENEIRFGVSPLADAAQIAALKERGVNQQEIAALFGVSEATVCRRAKLLDLTDTAREFLARRDAPPRSLELVAAMPPALQAEVTEALDRNAAQPTPLTVTNYARTFTLSLDSDAPMFRGPAGEDRLAKCRACPFATGNSRDLFDDQDKFDGELGRCMNEKCYNAMRCEAKNLAIQTALIIAKIPGAKYTVVDAGYKEPFASAAKRRSKARPYPVVFYSDNDGSVEIRYTVDPAAAREAKKLEREKAAKEREEIDRRNRIKAQALAKIKAFFEASSVVEFLAKLDRTKLERLLFELIDQGRLYTSAWMPNAHDSMREIFRRFALVNSPALAAELTDEEQELILMAMSASKIYNIGLLSSPAGRAGAPQ